MDKKQRKANEALKKSQEFLKSKAKQQVKQLAKEEVVRTQPAFYRKVNKVSIASSCQDELVLTGEIENSKVALLRQSVPAITIQRKKSILQKGQCVILSLMRTQTGVAVYVVSSADGRTSASGFNPTDKII